MNSAQSLFIQVQNHLLQDIRPSRYLEELYDTELFRQYPFDMLYQLKETEQSPDHHPEGNVWNHTMMVVDEAAKVKEQSSDQTAFMWAALLHDIGKPAVTRKKDGKITAYNHDKIGAGLAEEFLLYFAEDKVFVKKVRELVRYHMQILFVVKDLPFADIKGMKKHTQLQEVALLGLCDRLGRKDCNIRKEKENIKKFLFLCENSRNKK